MSRRVTESQIKRLVSLANSMGWAVEFPSIGRNGEIPGAILGSRAFIQVMKELVTEEERNDFNGENEV